MISSLRTIPRGIWILAFAALALRVVFMVAAVDLADDNYHEFGEIAKNMRAGHGYALFHFEGETLSPWFSDTVVPFPSAFMPPGYVLFIYPLLDIADPVVRNVVLLLIQHIAGALVVVLVFLLTRRMYTPRAAWMAAVLAAVLPDMVASANTYGATVFVHLLLLGIFLQFESREQPRTRLQALFLGCLLGVLALFRFEALAFAVLVIGLVWRASGLGFVWKVAFVVALFLTPWIVRNAVVFKRPLLSTSLGLNAYRGNNAKAIGAWSDPQLDELLPTLAGPQFEVEMSAAYFDRAWNYATSEPGRTLLRSATKVLQLWSFDPNDSRAKHPGRVAIWVLLMVFVLLGYRGVRPPPYILAYLVYATAMAFVFFALVRHQALMEIALIPLAGRGLARFCTFARLYPEKRSPETP